MKAAVAHLEPFLEKKEHGGRGRILLATVKGDVHDIGKNLVEIILANNGYEVVNLGIKVPPHDLVEAIREREPDLVGLSGLLVKSAQQMVVTAEELSVHGRCPPMLVGGAALTNRFTRTRIAPKYGGLVVYAKDAMHGLELANRLRDPEARRALERELDSAARTLVERRPRAAAPRGVRNAVAPAEDVPAPPDLERHVMPELPRDEVWEHLNPQMLFGKHLGLKGRFEELIERGDEKAVMLQELVDRMKSETTLAPRGVWRFLRARSEGDAVQLLDGAGKNLARLDFPRQQHAPGLCLADFVSPSGDDHVGLFAVTAGEGVRAAAERLKESGRFLDSHALQALALETAEGAAEWLHRKLRDLWGFPDPPDLVMRDRLRGAYRGKRYSFGYPACPDLEQQEVLFELLEPEAIGITLTEGHMMEPEASVSALVVHHPEARYFSVG
jgi:5-methyltetrahydrofolate--homocysteine methyltransferase